MYFVYQIKFENKIEKFTKYDIEKKAFKHFE